MGDLKILMLDLKSYYPSPPYQLGLLVAYACTNKSIKNQINFQFSEHGRETPASTIAEVILAAEVDLVAISSYAWNQKKITETLDILSSHAGALPKILIGGPNVSGVLGEEILKTYPIVSALVEGEGEPAFLDICTAMVEQPNEDPFVQARNITRLNPKGEIVRTNHGHRIKILDEIPSPYLTEILPSGPSPVFYETNRGCPYRCSFCYWGNGNSKVYRMSIERVRAEMEFFAQKRVRAFWLADANFGIFPSDSQIAEIMVEVNKKYNFPFRSVGVNWAKNSSDRVLEIAEIFRRGRISVSTTIALQTVTAEAEKQSKRYSMSPLKFMNLIRAAYLKNIDTYTDIILGLPGESLEEFVQGLDTVVTTGIPSVKIHQLVLIPGTDFYENRDKFGLKTLPETSVGDIAAEEKSDYFDCTVIGHPKMETKDLIRGRYFLGMVHMMHNHNLGQLVNAYLSRYGIRSKDVLLFLEELLLGPVVFFPEEKHNELLGKLRTLFDYYGNKLGVDDNQFIMSLSFKLWFTERADGLRVVNEPNVRAFLQDFYLALCKKFNCIQSVDEQQLLRALIDYNVLIAPKPTWRPEPAYEFEFNVHQIYLDIQETVLSVTDQLQPPSKGRSGQDGTSWKQLPDLIHMHLQSLLSDSYLQQQKRQTILTVKNPWGIPPSIENIDWLVNTKSKHCIISVDSKMPVEDGALD